MQCFHFIIEETKVQKRSDLSKVKEMLLEVGFKSKSLDSDVSALVMVPCCFHYGIILEKGSDSGSQSGDSCWGRGLTE